jgi:hypothetical protein
VDVPTESESEMVRYLLVVGADNSEGLIIVDLPPLLFGQLLCCLQLKITVQAIKGLIFNLLGAMDGHHIYSRFVVFKCLTTTTPPTISESLQNCICFPLV